ncbi:MAG TPA: prepilin-type N-terminal cleavage/methylation domain-containing protein [Tepidisphaeraceae bacterium]|jgi:prepilin-type N-terminal cleavage/methylation domain-containing protein|nr:prepilin-type N-terminal cleavage/methylation domain-containing protein [Tepidisphaeraceae bacterium]
MTTSSIGSSGAQGRAVRRLPAALSGPDQVGRARRFSLTRCGGGFTLLELLLVLAIIAIIVGLARPMLNNFARGRQLGDTAEEVIIRARWAHTQAVARGISYRLNFDPTKREIWLTMQTGPAFQNMLQSQNAVPGQPLGTNSATFDVIGDEMGQVFTVPDGITFKCSLVQQADGMYVEFHPSGRSDPASISFTDQSGRVIETGTLTATEMFHVLSDDERQLEQSMPVPPTAGVSR